MRNIITIIILILTVSIANAQYDYGKWALEAEVGAHSLQDPASESLGSILLEDGYHLGLTARYNFNPKFGLGLVGGYDNLTIFNTTAPLVGTINSKYYRVNVEGYVNIFKILDLYPKRFTMLVHGGPGVSWINSDTNNESVENLSGGVTGLYKVSERLALKLDFSSTGNIETATTFDGTVAKQNYGIGSTVHNLSIGATLYLGKKKNDTLPPHADWVKPEPRKLVKVENITNVYPKEFITNTIQLDSTCDCEYVTNEYVFFDHDKSEIRDTELNAIYKIYEQLRLNPDINLVIDGWASPTSSSQKYNLELSQKRSKVVYDKFIAMGIDKDRIKTMSYNGKDYEKPDMTVHDVARRVELILVKDK